MAEHAQPWKPAGPSTAEALRRHEEFMEQYAVLCDIRPQLLQEHGITATERPERWCVICGGELIGVFPSKPEATEAALAAADARGTDVYLWWHLRHPDDARDLVDLGGLE